MKQLATSLFIFLLALSLNAAPKDAEIDLRTLRRPEGARLTQQELTTETSEKNRVRQGLKLIEQGKALEATQDSYSKLNNQTKDNSAVRKRGEQQIAEGQDMVQSGAQRLQQLYSKIAERTEQMNRDRESGLLRTWTNSQGRQLEAAFISLEGEQLKLQTIDGNIHTLPLSKLSEADQASAQLLNQGRLLTPADITQAVEQQEMATIQLYLDAGYTPPSTTIGDLFSFASAQESPELLQLLLNSDWDPNAHNRMGQSPLSVAAQTGKQLSASSLLSAGASPLSADTTDDAFTPLMWAAHSGNAEMLQTLASDLEISSVPPSVQRLLTIAESGTLNPITTESLKQLERFESDEPMPYQERLDLNIELLGLEANEEGLAQAINTEAYQPYVIEFAPYPFYKAVISNNLEQIPELIKQWETQDANFNAAASYSLAICYLEEWTGSQNTEFALECLKDAGSSKYPPALALLAQLHKSGKYIELSDEAANQLLQAANQQGLNITETKSE